MHTCSVTLISELSIARYILLTICSVWFQKIYRSDNDNFFYLNLYYTKNIELSRNMVNLQIFKNNYLRVRFRLIFKIHSSNRIFFKESCLNFVLISNDWAYSKLMLNIIKSIQIKILSYQKSTKSDLVSHRM